MKCDVLFVCIAFLLAPVASEAILGVGDAVYDAAVHVEAGLTATRALLQLENQIQDLALLTDLTAFAELVQQAQELYGQVQTIAGPLLGRYQRWGAYIQAGPSLCNPYKLSAWGKAYSTETSAAFDDAAKAKPMFAQALKALQTLAPIVQQVLAINGTVKGLQTLNAIVGALLNRTVAMEAQNAIFQETVQRKDLKEHIEDQAMNAIYQAQRDALRGRKTCL